MLLSSPLLYRSHWTVLFVVQLKYLTSDLKLTITEKIFVLFAPKQLVLVSNRNSNLEISTPDEDS